MNLSTIRLLPKALMAGCMAVMVLAGCKGTTDIADYIGVRGADPYNPAKPVSISGFIPESGGVGQQMVIQGENFGNDTSIVKVVIGGKEAPVVSVKGDCLYTFVPSHAFGKKIEVTVGDTKKSLKEQTAVAKKDFIYERKMVVGTLCGYKNERDDQDWTASGTTFDKVAGFRNDGVMQFSPYNHDQLFVVYDQEPYHGTTAHSIQLIDLAKKTVTDVLPLSLFNNQRLRTIDFTVDPFAYDADGKPVATGQTVKLDEDGEPVLDEEGNEVMVDTYFATPEWEATATPDELKWREHIIVSADNFRDDFYADAIYIVNRDQRGNFSSSSSHPILAQYNQCNGAAVHPINGEIYFNSYSKGEMLRLDMNKYWETLDPNYTGEAWDPKAKDNFYDPTTGESQGSGAFEIIFTIQDNAFECQIDIHPEGKYAYIVVINHEYILKSIYNQETKHFTAPSVVAGKMNEKGNDDGVGTSARVARPYQGTFAVNKDYQREGREDIYDFFFCDSGNLEEDVMDRVDNFGSTIRCLTPEGIVSTYAGGGKNTHADGRVWGSENGELRDVARFYRPTGLVSDWNEDVLDENGKPTRIFYILDTMNRQIRTIGYEHEEEDDIPSGDGPADND